MNNLEEAQSIKEALSKEVPGLRWDVEVNRVEAVYQIWATIKINDNEIFTESILPIREYRENRDRLKSISKDVVKAMIEGFTKRITGE